MIDDLLMRRKVLLEELDSTTERYLRRRNGQGSDGITLAPWDAQACVWIAVGEMAALTYRLYTLNAQIELAQRETREVRV